MFINNNYDFHFTLSGHPKFIECCTYEGCTDVHGTMGLSPAISKRGRFLDLLLFHKHLSCQSDYIFKET